MSPYIEIHHNGQWHRAAKLHVNGEDRIRVDYDTGYLFSLESQPISLGLPLNMDPMRVRPMICKAWLHQTQPPLSSLTWCHRAGGVSSCSGCSACAVMPPKSSL